MAVLFFSFFMACRLCFILVCLTVRYASFAQVEPLDSAFLVQMDSLVQAYEQMERQQQVEKVVKQFEKAMLQKEMSFKTDGSLVLARGLLQTWTDHRFIKQPAQFEPKSDNYNWADYAVGGAPLIVNWALKAAGVQSRSKIERMMTANVMALGISAGTTKILKELVTETRPDRTDNHAFPSGHASFAFVSATVLSREYGYLSPWITIGSYATATTTQLLRIQHNKHWMNDLYIGAGIGTLSTNLAYFLTDKIFGEEAINKPEVRRKDVLRLMRFNEQPTGFSFIAGSEIGDRHIRFDDVALKAATSFSAGVDLSYYTSSFLAVELMTRMVESQVKAFGTEQPFTGGRLNLYHFDIAAKLSNPITLGHRMGTRVFVGVRMLNGTTLTNLNDATISYTIPNETKFELGLGINYECLDTDNYSWGFTCDYYHTLSHYMKNRYGINTVWKILF